MEKGGYNALVLFSILLGICSTDVAEAHRTRLRPWTKVPAIFAFGDSLVDSGTNNFIDGSTTRADFLPYGVTWFRKATGRFTNGRHAVHFIASYLGLPFIPPFLKLHAIFYRGANFGSAGSGILSSTGGNDGVVSLRTQVDQFKQVTAQLTSSLGGAAAVDLIPNALFFFITGSNDLSAYLSNATLQQSVNSTQFVTSVLSQLRSDIQTVYALGARKVVLFGVAPLGCAPKVMAGANATNGQCVAAPNQLAQAHNGALLELMEGLNSKLPDLHAVTGSTFDVLQNLINNGTALGFTKVRRRAVGADHSTGLCDADPTTQPIFVRM